MYEGGMYEDGFKCVLMCVLNSYGLSSKIMKEEKDRFFGEDICEGMIVIIFIKYGDF